MIKIAVPAISVTPPSDADAPAPTTAPGAPNKPGPVSKVALGLGEGTYGHLQHPVARNLRMFDYPSPVTSEPAKSFRV